MHCHLLLFNVLDCANVMVNLTNAKNYSENIIIIFKKKTILTGVHKSIQFMTINILILQKIKTVNLILNFNSKIITNN